MDIFTEIGLIIILASLVAYIFKLLKQPLIPAYVVAGLLFIVGMEIEIKKLKTVGLVTTLGGLVSSIVLFLFMFGLSQVLGLASRSALYMGLVFAFSSTMVVVKLLSDKRELGTLHGRIVVGRLLTEDFLAIMVLSFLVPYEGSLPGFFVSTLFKALLIFFGATLFARFILPPLFKRAATDMKLIFLLSLGLCFFTSMLLHSIGLSIAIGGFIAGVILANTPYNLEIISHVKPLRDFFATLFFVSLGMGFSLSTVGDILIPMFILLIVFYTLKPLLGFMICRFFGYTQSTAFLSAIALTQISEFSLIIASVGRTLGHISDELFSLIVLVAIITISLTSYLIKYDFRIYRKLQGLLNRIDIFKHRERELHYLPKGQDYNTLLVGYNRLGYHILKKLQVLKKRVLVIDFNPEVIHYLISQKIQCIYGDIGDIEILQRINLKKLELVISTVPEEYDNKLLIKETTKVNKHAILIVTAQTVESALELYDAGADYVVVPHLLGGEYLSILLEEFTSDLRRLIDKKLAHIEELKKRRNLNNRAHHFRLPL